MTDSQIRIVVSHSSAHFSNVNAVYIEQETDVSFTSFVKVKKWELQLFAIKWNYFSWYFESDES